MLKSEAVREKVVETYFEFVLDRVDFVNAFINCGIEANQTTEHDRFVTFVSALYQIICRACLEREPNDPIEGALTVNVRTEYCVHTGQPLYSLLFSGFAKGYSVKTEDPSEQVFRVHTTLEFSGFSH